MIVIHHDIVSRKQFLPVLDGVHRTSRIQFSLPVQNSRCWAPSWKICIIPMCDWYIFGHQRSKKINTGARLIYLSDQPNKQGNFKLGQARCHFCLKSAWIVLEYFISVGNVQAILKFWFSSKLKLYLRKLPEMNAGWKWLASVRWRCVNGKKRHLL